MKILRVIMLLFLLLLSVCSRAQAPDCSTCDYIQINLNRSNEGDSCCEFSLVLREDKQCVTETGHLVFVDGELIGVFNQSPIQSWTINVCDDPVTVQVFGYNPETDQRDDLCFEETINCRCCDTGFIALQKENTCQDECCEYTIQAWNQCKSEFKFLSGPDLGFVLIPPDDIISVEVKVCNGDEAIFSIGNGGVFGPERLCYVDTLSCCLKPINEFDLTDINGITKSSFCLGEEIILDASKSCNYDKFWRAIYVYDDGTLIGGEEESWTTSPIPEAYNILEDLPTVDLCPGYDYVFKLALKNECTNWVEKTTAFTIDCCEDQFDPSFSFDTGSEGSPLLINYQSYDELPNSCSVTHEWCIYNSDNSHGSHFKGELSDLSIYDNGLYTILHTLITPCGTFCYGGQFEIVNDVAQTYDECDLCGPIDCHNDCPPCVPPAGITCVYRGEFPNFWLEWNPVPGAIGYEIEFIRNNPACCNNNNPIKQENMIVENTSYCVEEFHCTSYRIRTICDDNEFSEWSDIHCFDRDNPFNCIVSGLQESSNSRSVDRENAVIQFKIKPNPVWNQLVLEGSFKDNQEYNISIYSLLGQKKLDFDGLDDMNLPIDVSNLNSGVYILQIKTRDKLVGRYKFIKI